MQVEATELSKVCRPFSALSLAVVPRWYAVPVLSPLPLRSSGAGGLRPGVQWLTLGCHYPTWIALDFFLGSRGIQKNRGPVCFFPRRPLRWASELLPRPVRVEVRQHIFVA